MLSCLWAVSALKNCKGTPWTISDQVGAWSTPIPERWITDHLRIREQDDTATNQSVPMDHLAEQAKNPCNPSPVAHGLGYYVTQDTLAVLRRPDPTQLSPTQNRWQISQCIHSVGGSRWQLVTVRRDLTVLVIFWLSRWASATACQCIHSVGDRHRRCDCNSQWVPFLKSRDHRVYHPLQSKWRNRPSYGLSKQKIN